jgi:hypothetical protein
LIERDERDTANLVRSLSPAPSAKVLIMRIWNVSTGKKSGGPFDTATLRRLFDARKLSEHAFIKEDGESTDWQQISTVGWLADVPKPGKPRYCLECDCRAVVADESIRKPIRCPECFTIGLFVDYLDELAPEILDAPTEPWGKYDVIACAFACVLVATAGIGALALLFDASLSILFGVIVLACGAALFAVTFQHRSESSKYRRHLQHVEAILHARTDVLSMANRELQGLKRSLAKVRSDLVETTEEEFRRKRREIADELSIARDQHNAVHRMAERFLTDTRKWWTTKLTGQNYQLTKERITKAIEFCRKQGYEVTATQQREILQQLKADYEIVLLKEQEKAQQIRMREQLREEQRVQRELAREMDRTEREAARREAEQAAIERALAEALQKVGAEHSVEVQRLQQSLEEAHQKVLEAQEAARRTKSQAELTRVGNVYVISNVGSFGENGFKVGLTRRLDPLDRVRELGDASVPFPFDVHMMIFSEDAPTLERTLHRALHRYRINRVNFRKEFFRVDLETIRKLVEKHHGKVEYEYRGDGAESEYQQSLKISDDEFASLASLMDEQSSEDDDDDMDGIDEP